jgi:hypothetical protein
MYSDSRKAIPLGGGIAFFISIREARMLRMIRDVRADMAEKAVVMFLIILAAFAAFQFLGVRISDVVNAVANGI